MFSFWWTRAFLGCFLSSKKPSLLILSLMFLKLSCWVHKLAAKTRMLDAWNRRSIWDAAARYEDFLSAKRGLAAVFPLPLFAAKTPDCLRTPSFAELPPSYTSTVLESTN